MRKELSDNIVDSKKLKGNKNTKDIGNLRNKLKSKNPDVKTQVVEHLVNMGIEGSEEAAEELREVLRTEADTNILRKIFEAPIQSRKDKRIKFFLSYGLNDSLDVLPLIEKGKLSDVRSYIVERAKEAVKIDGIKTPAAKTAISILVKLLDIDQMYDFVDLFLKKEGVNFSYLLDLLYNHPELSQKILGKLAMEPESYSNNFVKIFCWFLENPHPYISEKLGKMWLLLPSNFKEAIKQHYHGKMEHLYKYQAEIGVAYTSPPKHPLLQWLESFERGVAASSPSSFSALQAVAEKAGLHLKDDVRQMETEEPSPITRVRQRREEAREENIELIPIDKLLGEYFSSDQLIKLYMNEIRTSAKSLNVQAEALKRVVELHESAHAIVHLGRDADGRNFNTGSFGMVDGGDDPSPLHETIAQLLCYHCVKNDPELLECFERLNKRQLEVYTLWESFKDVDLERVRNVLVAMREGRVEPSFRMFEKLVLY